MNALSAWRAMHFFVSDEPSLDVLTLACRQALLDHAADPADWFFIRYTEGGLHLRLRCGSGAIGAFEAIAGRVTSECQALSRPSGKRPPAWLSLPTAEGHMYDPGSAVEVAYIPELVRYGGPVAIALHERLFRVSSAIAATLIDRTPHGSTQRMQHAIDLMLATVAGLTGESDAVPFFRHYANSWRRDWGAPSTETVVTDARARLSERYGRHLDRTLAGGKPRTAADLWVDKLTTTARELRSLHDKGLLISPITAVTTTTDADLEATLASMAHSQIHMMNNRLGFWPHYEIMFSELMIRHLVAG